MKLTKCENRHFYDENKFSTCPECKKRKSQDDIQREDRSSENTQHTISLWDADKYIENDDNGETENDLLLKSIVKKLASSRDILLLTSDGLYKVPKDDEILNSEQNKNTQHTISLWDADKYIENDDNSETENDLLLKSMVKEIASSRDILLLTSDGLYKVLKDEKVLNSEQNKNTEMAFEELLEKLNTNDKTSQDNKTCLLLKYL